MPTRYEVKELKVVHSVTVCRIEWKTPKRLPDVKVPAIKLPVADDKIRRKVRVHIICVLLGGVLAIVATFVSGGLIHWVPFLPTFPNLAYEILDRINDR